MSNGKDRVPKMEFYIKSPCMGRSDQHIVPDNMQNTKLSNYYTSEKCVHS